MTDIEWTDQTWNPITGCTKLSPGCKNCYAERMAKRLQTIPGSGYADGFKLTFHPDRLEQPLHWKKPRMVFVCSMSDLFHDQVSDDFRFKVFQTILYTSQHTYQILTKRADNMHRYFTTVLPWDIFAPNIWIGVSVEDRKNGLPRIDHLRNTPAALRFLSVEPLLEDLGAIDLRGIDWVIVGGESGPGARACDLDWIRSVVSQCQAAKIPVFVKQLGARPVTGVFPVCVTAKGGDPDEWPEDLRVRQMPEARHGCLRCRARTAMEISPKLGEALIECWAPDQINTSCDGSGVLPARTS